jgi:CrcB protein
MAPTATGGGILSKPPQAAFLLPPEQMKGLGMGYVIVFIGGGMGAALRHGINLGVARWFGTGFPLATLIINVSGSLMMGLIAGYFAFRGSDLSQHWRLFLTTGILGGYTTFSAFSLDVAVLYERGEFIHVVLYIAGSVALSIFGIFLGLAIARSI